MSAPRSKMLAQALQSLVVEDQQSSPEVARRFSTFLGSHGLLYMLPAVVRHLERIHEADREKRTLHISTAHPISSNSIESIRKRMEVSADAYISVEEDPDVIGGFIGRFGEMIYDASIRRQISLLREKLIS